MHEFIESKSFLSSFEFIASPADKIRKNQNPRSSGNKKREEKRGEEGNKRERISSTQIPSSSNFMTASVIRVLIAILADGATYREKEDVDVEGEGVNMYIHTCTHVHISLHAPVVRDIIPWKARQGVYARVACTCAGGGPRGVRILYGGFQARMGDQCFIDIAADAPLIRLESAVAHI